MPDLLVPDASLLLKWVIRSHDEEDQERALALKAVWLSGACEIVVPTLWVFEVGNILGLKLPSTASELLEAMVDLRMPEAPPATYMGEIFRLMRTFGVTFYDAAYHGLAISRGATMLTADRRYVRKVARAGHISFLGDWQPPRTT